ncbi:uncharacterized protein [Diadema antillarum]|uniref:uncharacterized protein n=1 Tax=Diadema antillarum TaxID=105358 RepID=UPI003A87E57F
MSKGIVFPPLTQALNHTNRSYFQEHSLMVQGDALQNSPMSPRGLEEELRGRRGSVTGRPVTSSRLEQANVKLAEELKDLQNKEKQYKNKIHNLQKAVEQLRLELRDKEDNATQANLKLQQMEEHYKLLYEEEKSAHEITRQRLSQTQQELEEKESFVEALKGRHEQHVSELKDHFEAQLAGLRSKMEAEIADRDRRLDNLKKQMAGALKENSWERQQQLEELSKELSKMSDEANMLKMKLKAMAAKPKSLDNCENCPALKSQLEVKQKMILEKDLQIKQLMGLCKKFETQLSQQKVLNECYGLVHGGDV